MRGRGLILLALSAVLLTACGGGEDAAQTPAPGTPENPLQALPNPAPTRVPPTSEAGVEKGGAPETPKTPEARKAAIVKAQQRVQAQNTRARSKRAAAKAGRSSSQAAPGSRRQKALAPSASRPCSLVSTTQARAIIGSAILAPLEAPQGPTCIYQTKSGTPYITLAVQTVDFAKLRKQIRNTRSISVASRTAYCGTYGKPMLFLPVTGGRVLSITAPCTLAQRFAAKAATHL